jgi:hypothetical protein
MGYDINGNYDGIPDNNVLTQKAQEYRSRKNPTVPKPTAPMKPLYAGRSTDKFDDNKYNIKNYSYPDDIMSDNYGKNYAIFYINVAIDSKLFNDKTVETVDDYAPRDRGQLIAINRNLYGEGTGAGAKTAFVGLNATASAIAGGGIGAIAGGKKGAALGVAAAAAPGAIGVGAAATQAASVTRAQKRLKTAIALHIPNQLNIRYSTNWGDEDTFAYQAAASGAEAIIKSLKGGGIKNLGNDAASIVGAMGLKNDKQGAAASAAMGLAANPKKEQVFKGVDFRTFQFDYQFFPRSPEEASNVLNIIQEFKYHMHPEFKDTNNFLYIYPSEFDIFYYQNGEENLNIHRHTSCVLTEMNINYTPNGMFNTFANGMPTQINVQMTFRELALVDKDKVKDGL